MKNLILLIAMFSCVQIFTQTSLKLRVIDRETRQPINHALVGLYQNGILILEEETDNTGSLFFGDLEAGIFDLEINHIEYQGQRIIGVEVIEGEETIIIIRLEIGLSLDKIVNAITRKTLRRADRKIRKYVKGITLKGLKRKKKGVKQIGRNRGKKRE